MPKGIECDIMGCRRRKGVISVQLEVIVSGPIKGEQKRRTDKATLELCPEHHKVKAKQRDALLSNSFLP